MQTERLKQNVKEKVKDIEDGGLRLLKKGQKGVVRAIFSRFGIVLLLLLLQVGVLFGLFVKFEQLLPHYLGSAALFSAVMVIYLLNTRMDNSAKITWLIVIMLLPVLGGLLFLYTESDLGHRMLKRRLSDLSEKTRTELEQDLQSAQRLTPAGPRRWCAGPLSAGNRRRLPAV